VVASVQLVAKQHFKRYGNTAIICINALKTATQACINAVKVAVSVASLIFCIVSAFGCRRWCCYLLCIICTQVLP